MIANETLPEFILLACKFVHGCTAICTLHGCCGSVVSLGRGEKNNTSSMVTMEIRLKVLDTIVAAVDTRCIPASVKVLVMR